MKRRTRLLKTIAMESLTLAVEVFNRPSPTARTQGVLLNLQHAFEMLLKATMWEDRGRIQPTRGGTSYPFRECVGIVRGMGRLSEDEAVVAASIAAHRDAVQHQGAVVSEERLYVDTAGGLRLFDDMLDRCFSERLADHPTFSSRMLPVTAHPPHELHLLTGADIDRVKELLKPGRRRHAEALAMLRTLVVSDQVAIEASAEVVQPTEKQLERIAKELQDSPDWTSVLPGLGRLSLEHDEGATYSLRIVKAKDAPGVRVVKPGEPGAEDAASILKVSELDHWRFYLKDLASQAGLTRYEVQALVHLLGVKDDPECFRLIMMGKQAHQRYTGRALRLIRDAKAAGRVEEAKAALRAHRRLRHTAPRETCDRAAPSGEAAIPAHRR